MSVPGAYTLEGSMIVIRYTGWGWLAFMLFMAVGVACFMLSSALGLRDDAFLIGFAVSYVVIGTPLHWRIGRALNASPPIHMFNGMPMEYWAVWYPVIGLVVAGIVVATNGYTVGAWAI